MICITSNAPPTRVPPKTYRIRNDAIDAALLALGPLARPGFEFKCWKCDGVWHWRALDEVPEPTHAQLKANGGRKFMGTAMAAPASEALATRVAVLQALVGELILRQAHSDH
jgi:hypothetical protein